MAIQMQTQSFRLDENDPRYRCCCGCCHSKTGTLAIGIASTALYAGSLIKSVVQLATYNSGCRELFDETDCQNTGSEVYISGSIVGNAICLLCAILLIVGAQKRIPGCLIPFMVVTALSIIGYCVLAIYAIMDRLGIVLAICAIGMAVNIWFMVVVIHYYQYLKASSSQGYGGNVQAEPAERQAGSVPPPSTKIQFQDTFGSPSTVPIQC